MTSTVSPATSRQGEHRFLIDGIDWKGYEALLKIMPRVRITYDRGVVELMSPLFPHELYKSRLGRLIVITAEELGVPLITAGSTTYKRFLLGRGLEPDESYYLGGYDRLTDRGRLNLDVDPPPDLVVEVDITSSSLDRMGIYAALGVVEVWRFDGESLTIQLLQKDKTYVLSNMSSAFPFLPLSEIPDLILDGEANDEIQWGKEVRRWVKEVVVPGAGDNPPG